VPLIKIWGYTCSLISLVSSHQVSVTDQVKYLPAADFIFCKTTFATDLAGSRFGVYLADWRYSERMAPLDGAGGAEWPNASGSSKVA